MLIRGLNHSARAHAARKPRRDNHVRGHSAKAVTLWTMGSAQAAVPVAALGVAWGACRRPHPG
jgi:hypothetical protein